jgi:hypothetical protein
VSDGGVDAPASGGCGCRAAGGDDEGSIAGACAIGAIAIAWMLRRRSRRHAVIAVVIAAGCAKDPSVEGADAAIEAPHVDAPRASALSIVRRSFVAVAGEFEGRGKSQRTRVDASGRIVFVPKVLDRDGATFALETRSIARGDRFFDASPRSVSLDGAEIAIDRGRAIERVAVDDESVEVAWSFVAAPEGAGDLVVALDAHGASLRDDGTTIHLGDRLGARVGQGTFVDAAGRSTPVDPDIDRSIEAGAIVYRVPASVLASATWPATLDPTVSSEIDVEKPSSATAHGDDDYASIAFDGTRHLLVWIWSDSVVAAMRIAADGSRIDALPFAVGVAPTGGFGAARPQVVWDGTTFVVFWGASTGIVGVRVKSDGTIVDTTPFTVTSSRITSFDAACDGTQTLVAWRRDTSTLSYLEAVRVASGAAVGGVIPIESGSPQIVAVAGGAPGFELAWAESVGTTYELRGTGVSSTGTLLDASPVALFDATQIMWPAIAKASTGWIVAYDDLVGGRNQVQALRLGDDRKPSGTPMIVAATSADETAPVLAQVGATTFVAWTHAYTQTMYARIDATGVLDTSGLALGNASFSSTSPALSPSGANVFAVWSDARDVTTTSSTIYGTPIASTGVEAKPTGAPVVASAKLDTTPAIATDGTNYLVVFEDGSGPDVDLYGVRLSSTAVPLDTTAFPIATGPGDQKAPTIARDGARYLVTYEDHAVDALGDIAAIRVSSSGTLIDPAPIVIASGSTQQVAPTASCSPSSGCLIAWREPFPSTFTSSVDARRIDASGASLDATPIVITTTDGGYAPSHAVAWNGSDWLIAWSGGSSWTGAAGYRRVTTAGAMPESPSPLAVSAFANDVVLVSDGASHSLLGGVDNGVGPEIARIDGTTLLDAPGVPVSVGFLSTRWLDGGSFATTSVPGRGWFVAYPYANPLASTELWGSFVAADGTALDAAGLALSTGPSLDVKPAVASAGGDKVVVVYQRLAAPPYATTRVFARSVSAGLADGTSCALKDDCASRFCVGGVCCASLCDGICQTCAATGSVGACVPVTGADSPGTCAGTMTCDATGACKKKSGQSCTATSDCASGFCVGGVCCASACTGACETCGTGACVPITKGAPGTPACAPFVCTGASDCPTSCANDGDCVASAYCTKGHVCAPRKAIGAACDLFADCASSPCGECTVACVSGFCCDSACDAPCNTCAGASKGTCALLPASSEGSCAPYRCTGSSSACSTTCTVDADCAASGYCTAGACAKRHALGEACTDAHECVAGSDGAGHCADGVCCDAACKGICESCGGATKGACLPVVDLPASGHGTCPTTPASDGSVCGERRCDGKARATCDGYVKGNTCRSATCVDGASTSSAVCDGAGACSKPTSTTCSPFICTAGACRTDCATDDDCAGGYHCISHTCKGLATCGDATTVVALDGSKRDCAPYLCVLDATEGATCGAHCGSNAECAPGHRCDARGVCVSDDNALDAPADSGCGCRVAGDDDDRDASFGAIALSLLACIAWLRRARRTRNPEVA